MTLSRTTLSKSLLAISVSIGPLPLDAFNAQAQTNRQIGAGAAGLAIGVILGTMATQGANQQPPPSGTPERRTYRSCPSIYGPGAANASEDPARCVCISGYTWTNEGGNQRCVRRSTASTEQPHRSSSNTSSSSSSSATPNRQQIEKIQEALNLLNYDAGSVDGALGDKTRQAIRQFQQANGFPQTGQLTTSEQQRLFKMVEEKKVAATSPPTTRSPEPPPSSPAPAQAPAKPDPAVEVAHWNSVKDSKNPAEIEDYLEKYPNGTYAKLANLRLEKLREQKETKELEAPKPSTTTVVEAGAPTLPPIDDASMPRAKMKRGEAVAVIIGNSNYQNGVPNVDFAHRDAEAMKLLLIKTMGLDPSNVILEKDATRGKMDAVFGTDKTHKGELWRRLDDEHSDIYVFYSGHGVPGINGTDGNFLLPIDGDPKLASFNGYPVAQLYKNLGELKAKSVTVFLDACFSGQSPGPGQSTPSLIQSASPVFISRSTPSDSSKINVFAAASERQLSSWDIGAGHGIFTRALIKGLSGEADQDRDKQVSTKELHDYVVREVKRTARRVHGREQEPYFTGNQSFVLSQF